jgi:long-chain acyl-CoA synthetase
MSPEELESRVTAAIEVGMGPAVWAQVQPHKAAVIEMSGGIRTFRELNANANRIARQLRLSGLSAGDAAALVCSNRAEFADVLMATMRIGVRLTPVNWHLTPEEIAYVVHDCEAKAVFVDVATPGAHEVAAGHAALGDRAQHGLAIPLVDQDGRHAID